jgi:hypothetical protein
MLGESSDPLRLEGEPPEAKDVLSLYLAGEIEVDECERLLDTLLCVGSKAVAIDDMYAYREAQEIRVKTMDAERTELDGMISRDIDRYLAKRHVQQLTAAAKPSPSDELTDLYLGPIVEQLNRKTYLLA